MGSREIVLKKGQYCGKDVLFPISDEAKFLCNMCRKATFTEKMMEVLEHHNIKPSIKEFREEEEDGQKKGKVKLKY